MRAIGAAAIVPVVLVCLGAGCESQPAGPGLIGPPPPAPEAAPPPVRTYDYTHKVQIGGKRRPGQYWTVAILRFGDTKDVEGQPFGRAGEPGKAGTPAGEGGVAVNVTVNSSRGPDRPTQAAPMMNKRAREVLKHALVNSDAFTVVERERIVEVLREINFGKTRYADPASSPEEGRLLCVRYLLEGSLGVNEDKTLKDTLDAKEDYRDVSDSGPGLWQNIFQPGKVNRYNRMVALREAVRRRQQRLAQQKFWSSCYLSAYEVGTGEVKVSVMGLGTNGTEAINDAVEELIDELIEKDDGLRVAAVGGDGREVYLDVGSKGGIRTGERYQVVHLGKAIRSRHGNVIGHEETEVGEIEITEVRDVLSIARTVRAAGTIARGDVVRPAKH